MNTFHCFSLALEIIPTVYNFAIASYLISHHLGFIPLPEQPIAESNEVYNGIPFLLKTLDGLLYSKDNTLGAKNGNRSLSSLVLFALIQPHFLRLWILKFTLLQFKQFTVSCTPIAAVTIGGLTPALSLRICCLFLWYVHWLQTMPITSVALMTPLTVWLRAVPSIRRWIYFYSFLTEVVVKRLEWKYRCASSKPKPQEALQSGPFPQLLEPCHF